MRLDKKPEILAPAGTLDGVRSALDAGADAVYAGGKQFNMRMHRGSYNLTEDELAAAIDLAHERGKKLYLTLNNLLTEAELDLAGQCLDRVAGLQPDALIVQDLGMVLLARERCAGIPLHASTMMNVHCIEAARVLKLNGFTRVIPSRDIPLHAMRRIGEESGLELETFVHGDLCVSQSSQCFISGQLFGESSNCGRCMKPCRWQWRLERREGEVKIGQETSGYLLARKDLCLLRHVPELVANNIVSFKIEGRMRTKEFVAKIVQLYRQAVDAYFADPLHFALEVQAMETMFMERVRELTTAHAFGRPPAAAVDLSGKREPRFFSENGVALKLSAAVDDTPQGATSLRMELVAHVNGTKAAMAAAEAGADAVYFAGDRFMCQGKLPDANAVARFALNPDHDCRVGILSPRITDEQALAEWRCYLEPLAGIDGLVVGVSTLGALHVARDLGCGEILGDYSLNLTNSMALDEFSTLGGLRVTAGIEASWRNTADMIRASRMPVELVGQGPLAGMLLEHCLIASASGKSADGVCAMPCRRGRFSLHDTSGLEYRVENDRRCRSHLYLPTDVCVLPQLSRLSAAKVAGVRIEAQFDRPEVVGKVVKIYRTGLDALAVGLDFDAGGQVSVIAKLTGRRQTDGPYAFDRAGKAAAVPARV